VGATAVALLATIAGTASGQTAQTFEELRSGGRVKVGDTVTVEDETGRRFRGSVRALDDDSLLLRTESARSVVDRVFTEGEVTRVRTAGTRAMPIAGLTGAGVAFALTAVAAARYGRNEGAESCGACLVQWSTMTVPIGAVTGALIGFSIDRASVRTVFARGNVRTSVSVAPLLGPDTFGGFATIRF
jgi:hypothetical protein